VDAAAALADLTEISSQVETAVVFGSDGSTLASTFADDAGAERLVGAARALLAAAGELPTGTDRAATLRTFAPATRRWSIWWIDSRTMRLEPRVLGRFENGLGTFLGDDSLGGRPIRVRFIWSAITPDSARWEQAFSADGGATWETNWIMDFRRSR